MNPASDDLSDRLNALRDSAGLTGETLAGLLGWSPSKVSRIMKGRQIPSVNDTRALAEVLTHPELAGELLALRETATVHARRDRRLAEEGSEAELQHDVDELTRNAVRIRDAQVTVIPGLLQAPGYARAIFGQVQAVYPEVDIDAAVRARMARREILQEEGRTFEFIIAEAALRMPPCPREVMFAQIDRLLTSMDLPDVTLGIIPQDRQVAMSFYNPFTLLDDLLLIESYGFEAQVTGVLHQGMP